MIICDCLDEPVKPMGTKVGKRFDANKGGMTKNAIAAMIQICDT